MCLFQILITLAYSYWILELNVRDKCSNSIHLKVNIVFYLAIISFSIAFFGFYNYWVWKTIFFLKN